VIDRNWCRENWREVGGLAGRKALECKSWPGGQATREQNWWCVVAINYYTSEGGRSDRNSPQTITPMLEEQSAPSQRESSRELGGSWRYVGLESFLHLISFCLRNTSSVLLRKLMIGMKMDCISGLAGRRRYRRKKGECGAEWETKGGRRPWGEWIREGTERPRPHARRGGGNTSIFFFFFFFFFSKFRGK